MRCCLTTSLNPKETSVPNRNQQRERTKRRMSDNDLKTHPLVIWFVITESPHCQRPVSIDVGVVESAGDVKTPFRHAPIKEESFSDLNLYLLIAIVCVSVIFFLSLISLIAVKCHRTDSSLGRYSAPMSPLTLTGAGLTPNLLSSMTCVLTPTH